MMNVIATNACNYINSVFDLYEALKYGLDIPEISTYPNLYEDGTLANPNNYTLICGLDINPLQCIITIEEI